MAPWIRLTRERGVDDFTSTPPFSLSKKLSINFRYQSRLTDASILKRCVWVLSTITTPTKNRTFLFYFCRKINNCACNRQWPWKKINEALSFLFYTVLAKVFPLSWFISCFCISMEYSIGEVFASYSIKKSNFKMCKISSGTLCNSNLC